MNLVDLNAYQLTPKNWLVILIGAHLNPLIWEIVLILIGVYSDHLA